MFTDMNINELILQYTNGASMAQLSRIFNITPYRVKKILESNNVQIRTKAQQNQISNAARAKSVNHTYFNDIKTPTQAWILGFIAADGWVEKDRNRINIELSVVDKEILEKIKKELEIENPIIERETGNGFSVVRLNWSSGPQKEALSKFGIVNRKTYKEMHLPLFEDKNLTYAFILGFFDGDGTISIDKDYCRFRLCAHRSELLEDIKNFLNVPSSLNQDNRGLWEFSISTIYSVPLFKKLYSLDSIYLERKHNKFLEYNKSKRV